jgi:acyl-CoA synthetase (AMP-forming)/AMP-acid ligase II
MGHSGDRPRQKPAKANRKAVRHSKVAKAAVIGVSHPKWDERPLLVVVLKQEGRDDHEGGHPWLHAVQDRQMVDAARRGVRRRNPAHRKRGRFRRSPCASASRVIGCRRSRRRNEVHLVCICSQLSVTIGTSLGKALRISLYLFDL